MKEARGKYIVRVDPDDRHRPCFLSETVPILEKYPEVGLVYGDVALMNEQGQVTVERSSAKWREDHRGNELVERR